MIMAKGEPKQLPEFPEMPEFLQGVVRREIFFTSPRSACDLDTGHASISIMDRTALIGLIVLVLLSTGCLVVYLLSRAGELDRLLEDHRREMERLLADHEAEVDRLTAEAESLFGPVYCGHRIPEGGCEGCDVSENRVRGSRS